eukprot:1159156-Pelagomonas_calceolata.AAC.20
MALAPALCLVALMLDPAHTRSHSPALCQECQHHLPAGGGDRGMQGGNPRQAVALAATVAAVAGVSNGGGCAAVGGAGGGGHGALLDCCLGGCNDLRAPAGKLSAWGVATQLMGVMRRACNMGVAGKKGVKVWSLGEPSGASGKSQGVLPSWNGFGAKLHRWERCLGMGQQTTNGSRDGPCVENLCSNALFKKSV